MQRLFLISDHPMVMILKRRRTDTQRAAPAVSGRQTIAGQLEELSRQLWAGEITKPEHDKLRDAVLSAPTNDVCKSAPLGLVAGAVPTARRESRPA